MARLTMPCLFLAALFAGCGNAPDPGAPARAASPPAAGSAATKGSVAQVPGIEWFQGDIDAAFDAAAGADRLVFLYWGAEWCPPCYDLKAHVFPRADFQQALRQFVPVYLDGDAPGAQRIAEQFRVVGYPSAVVLRPDRTEIARISGGSDLASYAQLLALSLEDAQPVAELLAGLDGRSSRPLDAAQCRRLAWNDWSMWEGEEADLPKALQRAARQCPAEARAERDRLTVQAADFAAAAESGAMEQGAAASPLLRELVGDVTALLADAGRSRDAGNALLYLDDEFFAVAARMDPAGRAALQQRYFALLDAVEQDERQSDTTRLLSAARRVQAAKALGTDGQVPEEVARRARATLDEFLARDYEPNARAGVVNSASWVLTELGDDARLRALLEEQMQHSRTPYYYMPDIADIEERAGHHEEALKWLERGYRESRGPATRFQWGTLYVDGLLRMAPQDAARIRKAVLEVLGELQEPGQLHARTRTRLARLDASLDAWAEKTGNAATVAAISREWRGQCAKLPAEDPAREGCADLLG